MNEPLLQIVDWDATFERAGSRGVLSCAYVCHPNKHHSVGLTNLMAHPDGTMIYGVWVLIVQLCSRQKKPREGWLTENGRRDGRRYTSTSLAFHFRRPVEEILQTLRVVCSPDLGWLEIVEGQPHWPVSEIYADGQPSARHQLAIGEASPKLQLAAVESNSSSYAKQRQLVSDSQQSSISAPSASHQPSMCIRKEGKERKKPPAVPQGGQRNGHLLDSPMTREGGQPANTSDSSFVNEQITPEVSDPTVAKELICSKILNGKNPQRPWSFQAQARLRELLPIPLAEIDDIGWFRSIEKSDDIPELKARRDPITETTLMDFWGDEVQRAREYRRKYYRKHEKEADWPEGAKEIAEKKWPDANLPERMADLPGSVRQELEKELAN